MTHTRIEIRTTDTDWAARNATPGRNGRVVISVDTVERLPFAGVDMVRFDMQTVAKRLPNDWFNRYTMVPASWVVAA